MLPTAFRQAPTCKGHTEREPATPDPRNLVNWCFYYD